MWTNVKIVSKINSCIGEWKFMKKKIFGILILGILLVNLTGCGNKSIKKEDSIEEQVSARIESGVAVEIKLSSSTSVQAHVYSISINGDTATFKGKYTGLGAAYGTVSGTFKGTCNVKVTDGKVYVFNEKFEID